MCMESAWARIWRVSTHGRVCNTRGQISYGTRSGMGDRRATIVGKHFRVHRLVAFAHLRLPPTPLHDRVLHVDGNPDNNHVSNLKYATSEDCASFSAQARTGRECSKSHKVVFSRAPGDCTWTSHHSLSAAAGARDVSITTVWKCSSQGCATRSGLEFRYAPFDNLLGEEWRAAVHPLSGRILHSTMVSSMGRVFNAKGNCSWGTLTPAGYRKVSVDGTVHFVHRLVLCSFAEALPSYSWVSNHIDGNKQNNCLDNLEFATHAQNTEHAFRANLCSLKRSPIPVLGRPLGSKEWIRFESQTEAERHVCCWKGAVSTVCMGRRKSANGWEFQRVIDDSTLPGEQWAPVGLELPAE
mmetsp:Transcript_30600/g.55895  ORF Transcript_30600/g.55895 Transcript_30600/m.55895 type:complete len:354 (+) Transcript_30600:72-1133(+)